MTDTAFTPGPWRSLGNSVYADVPQDVDHSAFRGFNTPEKGGFLIAESIPHKPTRDLITAAPSMIAALEAWVALAEDAIRELGLEMHPDERAVLDRAKAAIDLARGKPRDPSLKNFWVSWCCAAADFGCFELRWPWWVSGTRLSDDAKTICAAVQAPSRDAAMKIIEQSYDVPKELEWRFCEARPPSFTPFTDRFRRDHWMQWPVEPTT